MVRRVRGYGQRHEDVGRIRVRLGDGLSGRAAVEREPIRVGDVGKDSRYLPGL